MANTPYREPPSKPVRLRPCACDCCRVQVAAPERYCAACAERCVFLVAGRKPVVFKRWMRLLVHADRDLTPEQKRLALDGAGKVLETGAALLRRAADALRKGPR